RVRWAHLLAARTSAQKPVSSERLRDRKWRDGGLDRDQPAEKRAQALDRRRLDQPRSSLFARRELRREPVLFRPRRLATAGRIAPACVPRAHRPWRLLATGGGDPQPVPRIS